MSTPSVPTKPDVPAAKPGTDRREENSLAPRAEPRRDRQQVVPPQPSGPAPSDRAVDADLLIDIPQLSVEELTLELDASLLLKSVKLDAKGLEAALYLKADFEHAVALAQEGRGISLGRQRGADGMRARTGLRELLGATRDAYRDLSDRDVQRQLQGVHASAREAYERITTEDDEPAEHEHNGDGGQATAVRDRARRALTQGAKAAGLTAAGVAGGALLESQGKQVRKLSLPGQARKLSLPGQVLKLSLPGRNKRARAIRDAIAKRLP